MDITTSLRDDQQVMHHSTLRLNQILTWARHALTMKAVLLLVLAFAIYGASLRNQFVMDDEEQIQGNHLTESLDHLGAILMGASTVSENEAHSYGVYYRPLMIASFAILRSTFGLDPLAFHVFQLLLHVANALLLFMLFRFFFSEALAFAGALIFLVHPMNTEAVSYIAAVQDPLFAFFGLVALNWIVQTRTRISWLQSLGLAFLFLSSLLSKESGALFLFFSLLYVGWRRRESASRVGLSACLAIATYLGVRIGLAHLVAINHASTQLARAAFQTKLLTLPLILFSYLAKFVVPIDLACTQDWVVSSPDLMNFWLPLTAVIAVTALCLLVMKRRGLSLFTFFFVWSLAGLGLHSHLITALDGTVSERWFYVPCMGLIGLLLSLVAEHKMRFSLRRRWIQTGLLMLVLGFSYLSFTRSMIWKDGMTLFLNDVELQPDSAHLQNNSGVELLRAGRTLEGKEHLEKSVRLNPYWTISWNNLGVAYMRTQNLQKAEECYRKSIALGNYLLTFQNLAGLLVQEGRLGEAADFLDHQALTMFPHDPQLKQLASEIHRGKKP